jgi:hypothetical protein
LSRLAELLADFAALGQALFLCGLGVALALHPFLPAQAWPLPWHDPVPLQELMPEHVISSPFLSAANTLVAAPIANIPATDAAIIDPLKLMSFSSLCR